MQLLRAGIPAKGPVRVHIETARTVKVGRLHVLLAACLIRPILDRVGLAAPLRIERDHATITRETLDLGPVGIGRARAVRLRVPAVKVISRQLIRVCAQRLLFVAGDNLPFHEPRARRGRVRRHVCVEAHGIGGPHDGERDVDLPLHEVAVVFRFEAKHGLAGPHIVAAAVGVDYVIRVFDKLKRRGELPVPVLELDHGRLRHDRLTGIELVGHLDRRRGQVGRHDVEGVAPLTRKIAFAHDRDRRRARRPVVVVLRYLIVRAFDERIGAAVSIHHVEGRLGLPLLVVPDAIVDGLHLHVVEVLRDDRELDDPLTREVRRVARDLRVVHAHASAVVTLDGRDREMRAPNGVGPPPARRGDGGEDLLARPREGILPGKHRRVGGIGSRAHVLADIDPNVLTVAFFEALGTGSRAQDAGVKVVHVCGGAIGYLEAETTGGAAGPPARPKVPIRLRRVEVGARVGHPHILDRHLLARIAAERLNRDVVHRVRQIHGFERGAIVELPRIEGRHALRKRDVLQRRAVAEGETTQGLELRRLEGHVFEARATPEHAAIELRDAHRNRDGREGRAAIEGLLVNQRDLAIIGEDNLCEIGIPFCGPVVDKDNVVRPDFGRQRNARVGCRGMDREDVELVGVAVVGLDAYPGRRAILPAGQGLLDVRLLVIDAVTPLVGGENHELKRAAAFEGICAERDRHDQTKGDKPKRGAAREGSGLQRRKLVGQIELLKRGAILEGIPTDVVHGRAAETDALEVTATIEGVVANHHKMRWEGNALEI